MGHNNNPYISAYSSSGFGSKYSNPSTLPANTGNDVDFSPDGNAVAVVHSGSPRVTAYAWSSSGFGSKYSNPSTTIPDARGVRFTHDSTGSMVIFVTHSGSPYLSAYQWFKLRLWF